MTNESVFFQPAFLWDGTKRLAGNLELKSDVLIFHFDNFRDSNIDLRILLERIVEVKLYKLYDLVINGLEIYDNEGRKNIFILNDPKKLKEYLRPVHK